MNDKHRTRLAEAMGLRCVGCTYIENKYGTKEFAPDACCDIHGISPYGFHPFTDANDCQALIRHLGIKGFHVMLAFSPIGEVAVRISHDWEDVDELWTGDDWKQGVCELALKVMDNDN